MKIRIKFSKQGEMKFIGHLDIMRYFQKAIRRAGINICYSEGFSPHQKMSFASPLGVGLISSGEYFDIEVIDSLSSKASVDALNSAMVNGMHVISFNRLPEGAKNCMAIIAAADYMIHLNCENMISESELTKFLDSKQIMIVKKTKKGEKEIDIRPFIYDAKCTDQGIFVKVAAGSADNLKPELIVCAMEMFFNKSINPRIYERLEIYAKDERNQLVTLESLGEIID